MGGPAGVGLETVFSGKTAEGKRAGVYVSGSTIPKLRERGFKWKYTVDGKLMDGVGGVVCR